MLLEVAVTHCKFYRLLRSDTSLFSSGFVWCFRIDPNLQGNLSRHLWKRSSLSWEANSSLSMHEIPLIFCKLKVYYRVYDSPPSVPVFSQISPFHFLPTDLRVSLINLLTSTSGSPKWSLVLWFPHQNPVHILLTAVGATCPAHLVLLNFISLTYFGRRTNHYAYSYAVFSSFSLRPVS